VAAARVAMVENQLRSRNITDPGVLKAMASLPRHLFVAPAYAARAYDDSPLPAAAGQTISQPYMVAIMTQELVIAPTDRILEIGTGTGYQTAVLALLGKKVYSIERIAELAEAARHRLDDLGIPNVQIHVGDGSLGWPTSPDVPSPPTPPGFERIVVTAGAPATPEALLAQLLPGGRAVIPEGGTHTQTLIRYERMPDGTIRRTPLLDCRFVPLIGAGGWPDDDPTPREA
jgi:protein-L-isoaspartate(D-aspartate) O-methyltransferase